MDLKLDAGLACLLLLCINFSCVSSLMCYVCSTKNPGEDDCAYIPEGSTKYLVNCVAPKNHSCRIQEQWIDFIMGDTKDKEIIRQCASTFYDPDKPCYYRTGYSGRTGVCNCLEDGCNEASRTVSSAIVGTLGLLLLVKLLI